MEYFTLYLDESKFVKKENELVNHIYAVAGVAINGLNESEIRSDLNKVKMSIWNQKTGYSVNDAKKSIFHEAEIRSDNVSVLNRQPNYRVFIGSSSNKSKAINEIGNIINKFGLTVFGAIIDQTSLKQKFGKNIENNSYESYYIALKVIVENFMMFLKEREAQGRIVFESRRDDINNIQDERTQKMIYKILTHGTTIYSAIDIQRSLVGVTFRKKTENVPGLQIADFIPRPLILSYSGTMQSKPSIYKKAIRKNRYNGSEPDGFSNYGVKVIK